MSDPIIDSINAPPAKRWWQSKTIQGLAIAAFSIYAPKYQPIAEMLPPVIAQIGTAFGLILGLYGRIKAAQSLK